MPAIARLASRIAALFLCLASLAALAQAPADPAVWGPYANVAGTQRRAQTYIVRWHWAKPGAELVEEFVLRGSGTLDYSNVITPGPGPGQLRLVSSYMHKEWLGTLQNDGSVLWAGSGLLKMPYRVSLAADGVVEMRRVKLRNGAITSVAAVTADSRFELIPDAEPTPAPADPSAWGVYARLAGADMSAGRNLFYRWSWRDKDTLVEDRGDVWGKAFITIAGAGALRYVTEDGKGVRDGTVQPDGSVVWTTKGAEPFRVSLQEGGVAYDHVTLRDGVVTKSWEMQRLAGTLPPPAARLARATPAAPASPATVAAPEAGKAIRAPAVAAAGSATPTEAAPSAPALSDFDASLQGSFEDMCASATERKSRFCDALVALIAKRQADGIAIEIHEPAPEKPAAKKGAAAGKKSAAKKAPPQERLSAHLGLMARLVDQPQFVFRTEPERDPPDSPDKGYVYAWAVPETELVWKRITAGEEGPAVDVFRWNAKRQKVVGMRLDPKAALLHEVTIEAGGLTQISTSQPNGFRSRSQLQSLPDGGLQWTDQVFRDGVWTTVGTIYTVPSTPEWIARWEEWQARRREEARLAAEAEQRRLQAEREAMAAQELARQQQEAEDDAEFEAERARKAAAWNATASAAEQGLADSIARLNETTARVQAQQEQYRLQQQYAQQAALAEQRQREAENARQATQRQYEIARQFEAQQQAQRQAQAEAQAEARAQMQAQHQAQRASAAAAGTASTLTDANTCVSRPIVGPNHACGKGTSASVTNQCSSPVDVRMCSMTPNGWDCSARWGLAPGASWSQAWCAGTSQVFMSARNSGSSTALGSP